MRAFHAALALRLLYLIFIIHQFMLGGWRATVSLSIIFLVTLPVLYLARKDWRFATSDMLFLGLSGLGTVLSVVGLGLNPTVFGVDKLFHIAGGAAVAFFAYFALRSEIKTKWILCLVIPAIALAVGAGWEFFEYLMYLVGGQPEAYFNKLLFTDTMFDMVADALGALLVACIVFVKKETQRS